MSQSQTTYVLVARGKLLSVDESSSGNKGRSSNDIAMQLLDAIAAGRYPVGAKLPSLRSPEYGGAAQQTVFTAMRQLVELGIVESRSKSGYYVASVPRVSEVRADVLQRLDEHGATIAELVERVNRLEQGLADS
jgi:DNA-binding GntR family transcriptional regulator